MMSGDHRGKADSGLGDSVRETGCHNEGMPSRAQTLREGKPGSPLPRRAENVAGGMLSDDVTEKGYALLCCATPEGEGVVIQTVSEDELLEEQLCSSN